MFGKWKEDVCDVCCLKIGHGVKEVQSFCWTSYCFAKTASLLWNHFSSTLDFQVQWLCTSVKGVKHLPFWLIRNCQLIPSAPWAEAERGTFGHLLKESFKALFTPFAEWFGQFEEQFFEIFGGFCFSWSKWSVIFRCNSTKIQVL